MCNIINVKAPPPALPKGRVATRLIYGHVGDVTGIAPKRRGHIKMDVEYILIHPLLLDNRHSSVMLAARSQEHNKKDRLFLISLSSLSFR